MKASRYIAEFLKRRVDHCFGLQGGAVVHLFDACERFGPKPIYCHHEQAAAFAASGYARINGLGVCIVTTGPGATNAITPCLGAWQDSIPVLFISGQVRSAQLSYGKPVRQVGAQEAPILKIIRPIVKYTRLIENADALPDILENAVVAAMSPRQGPVWLDICLDAQWAEVA